MICSNGTSIMNPFTNIYMLHARSNRVHTDKVYLNAEGTFKDMKTLERISIHSNLVIDYVTHFHYAQ